MKAVVRGGSVASNNHNSNSNSNSNGTSASHAAVFGSPSDPVDGRWQVRGRIAAVDGLGSEVTVVARHCREVVTLRIAREHHSAANGSGRRFCVVQSSAPLEQRGARHYFAVLRSTDSLVDMAAPPNAALLYPDPKQYCPLNALPRQGSQSS